VGPENVDNGKIIKLRVPRYVNVHVDDIVRVQSSTGDEKKKGARIYLRDGSHCYCEETVKKVREMMEEAKSKEEILLEALAINLLLKAAEESCDGRLQFAESAGVLAITVGSVRIDSLKGRNRSKYEYAEKQLSQYELVDVESNRLYKLNERGYQMAKFIVDNKYRDDQPFTGFVKLPARFPDRPTQIGVQINQWNNNAGDVNTAISETGDVEQAVQ
jgi:hypothetical protein